MNRFLFTDYYTPTNLQRLKDPASTCLLGDSYNPNDSNLYKDAYTLMQPGHLANYAGQPNFRHNKMCNILYTDGHVDGKKQEEIPTDYNTVFWANGM